MARLALAMVFVTSAFGFLLPKFWELLGRPPVLFVDLALCLPAVLLGSFYWWKGRCFSSTWPVVLCIGLVWLSLAYPGNVEVTRGTFIAALVTLPLPVAALVVEKRAWAFCAQVYVWANAAAMLAALWFESRVETSIVAALGRFGFLAAKDGASRMGNPNQVGGQLALAAVLAFVLYLKERGGQQPQPGSRRMPEINLALMILLSIGCMLTASRGAFASWLFGVGALFVWGTRALPLWRMKDLLAISMTGLLFAMLLMTAGGTTPWGRLQERFGDGRSNGSLSGRTEIWTAAMKAWNSNPDFLWRGTGTGMADDVLGQFTPSAVEDEQGVLRKNCHNAFVEWALSLGFLGLAAGGCLAASAAYQAIRLDRREANVGRLAILGCVALFAMGAVSYRHECWPATGTLVLAMLSEPRGRRTPLVRIGSQLASPEPPRPNVLSRHKAEPAALPPLDSVAAPPAIAHRGHGGVGP